MISVMILEGVYEYNDPVSLEFHDIYVPLLLSILRCKRIKCQTVDIKGLAARYKITGGNRESIIYAPKFEKQHENTSVSFIYCDSITSISPSFRVSSLIRNYRSSLSESDIVFVEQLKDNDELKNFAPIIVDNIKIPNNLDLMTDNSYLYMLGNTTADGICRYFGLDVE